MRFCLGEIARHAGEGGVRPILHVARDANRLATLEEALRFFAPDVRSVESSPPGTACPTTASRPTARPSRGASPRLPRSRHAHPTIRKPLIVLTTVNALLQKVPPRDFIAATSLKLQPGNVLTHAGADRASGDFRLYARRHRHRSRANMPCAAASSISIRPAAIRSASISSATRWNQIRAFDPDTQRTAARLESVQLLPMSEMTLTPEVISAFRQRYVALFGPVTGDDPLYESISAGRQHQGMEHWLPLFHDRLVSLFDYLPEARVTLDPLLDDARNRTARADRRPLRRARAGARAQGLRRAALSSRAARQHVPERGGLAGGAFRPPGRSRSIRSSIRRRRASSRSAAGKAAPSPPSGRPKGSTCSMRSWLTPSGCAARASA